MSVCLKTEYMTRRRNLGVRWKGRGPHELGSVETGASGWEDMSSDSWTVEARAPPSSPVAFMAEPQCYERAWPEKTCFRLCNIQGEARQPSLFAGQKRRHLQLVIHTTKQKRGHFWFCPILPFCSMFAPRRIPFMS